MRLVFILNLCSSDHNLRIYSCLELYSSYLCRHERYAYSNTLFELWLIIKPTVKVKLFEIMI